MSLLAGPITARLVGRTDKTLLVPAAFIGTVIILGVDLLGNTPSRPCCPSAWSPASSGRPTSSSSSSASADRGPPHERTAPGPCPRSLTASELHSGYGKRIVVDGVTLSVPSGVTTVIIGANARGKSTLLKTTARIMTPSEGAVLLDGKTITSILTRRLATRTAELADRSIDELSGGQRQRVWIAMALTQRTPVLLLDEPTTFLDFTHQVEVLELLTDLNRERGTTVVMVLHDINLSARYADHIIAMRAGRVVAAGAPREVVDAELVATVFDLDSDASPTRSPARPSSCPRAATMCATPRRLRRSGSRIPPDTVPHSSRTRPQQPRSSTARHRDHPKTALSDARRSTEMSPAGSSASPTSPFRFFPVTVSAIRDVTPSMRRFTFVGDDLVHFADPG